MNETYQKEKKKEKGLLTGGGDMSYLGQPERQVRTMLGGSSSLHTKGRMPPGDNEGEGNFRVEEARKVYQHPS